MAMSAHVVMTHILPSHGQGTLTWLSVNFFYFQFNLSVQLLNLIQIRMTSDRTTPGLLLFNHCFVV